MKARALERLHPVDAGARKHVRAPGVDDDLEAGGVERLVLRFPLEGFDERHLVFRRDGARVLDAYAHREAFRGVLFDERSDPLAGGIREYQKILVGHVYSPAATAALRSLAV